MKYLLLFVSFVSTYVLADTKTLQVGVFIDPPFVYEQNNTLQGIAIDLWEDIAKQQSIQYQYVLSDFNTTLKQVESGNLDIAIGSISITSEREQRFDFTSPYYQSGLALITNTKDPSLFTSELLLRVGGLLCYLIAFIFFGAVLLYIIERKNNKDLDTIESSSWWAIVTVTTTGYGDKVPFTRMGRLIASLFMICGALVFPTIITSLGAISAIDYSKTYSFNIHQLNKVKSLGVVNGTISHQYVINNKVKNFVVFNDLELMIHEFENTNSRIDAALYDRPMLELIAQRTPTLTVLPNTIMLHFYGFVVGNNSQLLEDINRSIPLTIASSKWSTLTEFHFNQ